MADTGEETLPDPSEWMEWGSDEVSLWMERKVRSLNAEGRQPSDAEEETLAEMATYVLLLSFVRRGIDPELACQMVDQAMDRGDIKITCTATEFRITTTGVGDDDE
jgi:hypothetical protein